MLFSYDQNDSNFHGLSLSNSPEKPPGALVKIHKLVLKKSETTKGDVNPAELLDKKLINGSQSCLSIHIY